MMFDNVLLLIIQISNIYNILKYFKIFTIFECISSLILMTCDIRDNNELILGKDGFKNYKASTKNHLLKILN